MELKTFSLDLGLLSDSIGVLGDVCVCVCGCILHVPVCVPLHFCMCGCLCADSYVMHICLYMSIYVCARVGAIMLRHLMINLYLTCLFTELLCRALWGLCCTQCCK